MVNYNAVGEQITVDLEPTESDVSSSFLGEQPSTGGSIGRVIELREAVEPIQLVSTRKVTPISYPITTEKVICFDVETTGTDPWDYVVLVCSFWDLSKPINEMVTFSGWDEEKLVREIADYLNTEKPDVLVCYNNGFDQRALLSRFMLYKVPVPGWNSIKQIDVMEILKKGTTQNIYSSQSPGAEEQWLYFFFGEKKPYNIDACFEGVRNGDLSRLVLRNRSCVESEGEIYKLFRYVTDVEPGSLESTKPTVPLVEESAEAGICLVTCPACSAVNQVPCGSSGNTCWRCLGALPPATGANVIKETVRQVDYSQVGLKSTSK